jgi:hypothetical protein
MKTKLMTMCLVVAVLTFPSLLFAEDEPILISPPPPFMGGPAPASGTFDIVTTGGHGGISFAPVPWVSPSESETIYFQPYAGSVPGNIAQAQFADGAINVFDGSVQTGDLGIFIGNYSGEPQTWAAGKVTLDFTSGSFDVFLPEFQFTFDWRLDPDYETYTTDMDHMYLWVADNGATYYANSSKGWGAPDMTAAQAMALGDTYLAAAAVAVPEPGALVLLLTAGLGALCYAWRRRRRA